VEFGAYQQAIASHTLFPAGRSGAPAARIAHRESFPSGRSSILVELERLMLLIVERLEWYCAADGCKDY